MPAKDRERLNRALNEMKSDPLSGDIVSLKGEHQGQFRRRVGSWRIIFALDPAARVILIGDIGVAGSFRGIVKYVIRFR